MRLPEQAYPITSDDASVYDRYFDEANWVNGTQVRDTGGQPSARLDGSLARTLNKGIGQGLMMRLKGHLEIEGGVLPSQFMLGHIIKVIHEARSVGRVEGRNIPDFSAYQSRNGFVIYRRNEIGRAHV